MWSYVQYRRIGQNIEEKFKTKEEDPHAGRLLNLESGELDSVIKAKASGENDPLDPKNWGLWERTKNITILSLIIFVQTWASAAESMANAKASREFHVSQTVENLATAMYLFGIGSGALFVGPLSDTVGRNPTYLASTFCYLFFVLGSALTPTFGGQVICRYFVGLFSSGTLATNGASVQDQFRPVKRAFVFPIVAWANIARMYPNSFFQRDAKISIAASTLAPIVGGWVISNSQLNWRWMEWITLIISGFCFLVAFLFLPETYLPILLRWKAEHLRRIFKDDRYISGHSKGPSFFERTKDTLPMTAIFLGKELVVAVFGGYLVLLYILIFTFLSGFDYIFRHTYHLSEGLEGSCFAAIAIGITTFTLCAPVLYTWARHKTKWHQGALLEPEFRLWPAIITAPLLPISLFWLGWTNYSHISIWSGLAACFVFGIVIIAFYVSIYEYIVDSYHEHAAVALASITMLRYFIAGGMVIAARPMYEGIGVQWTMTILGCVATILTPAPFIFWKFGHKLREKSQYAWIS